MTRLRRISQSTLYRVLRFALRRGLIIFLTIVIGLFIVVVIANRSGQIEDRVAGDIYQQATQIFRQSEFFDRDMSFAERQGYIDAIFQQMADDAGLNLPFFQRHLLLTWKALSFQWGEIMFRQFQASVFAHAEAVLVRTAVFTRLPNTLLLVGVANLLVFVIGLPLALNLSRRSGSRLDRLFAFLAPLSSVPSWVFGLLLILIFAIQLQWLPSGSKTGVVVDIEPVARALTIAKHMILPVTSIVLSLLFQFVYTWRSYFLVYADEDYVELARARGLDERTLQARHILRPTLPFIITSFTLSLVSFWQTTIALEVVFDWPGIGKLYVETLPNFFGEAMFPGDLVITVALVVIFAYLLGITVLALELVYALVDPRLQVDSTDKDLSPARKPLGQRVRNWFKSRRPPPRRELAALPLDSRVSEESMLEATESGWRQTWRRVRRELRLYPAAQVGLVIIAFLVLGSLYAVIGLPYGQAGREWYTDAFTGTTYVPRTAIPEWVNLFRAQPLLGRVILNSELPNPDITQEFTLSASGAVNEKLVFTIDYPYEQIPEEFFIYFDSRFTEKRPFVFWSLIRPDGQEIELTEISPDTVQRVDITEEVFSGPRDLRQAEETYPALAEIDERHQAMNYMFGALDGEEGRALNGEYQLVIDGLIFEPDSWVDAELVVLGQVHGVAGTDSLRRDLLIPLLWGMPFALLFGVLGSVFTVTVSLLAAAAGVWLGGWVDGLVQRLTDVNMVLPILAISVILFAYFHIGLWTILIIVILFGSFGSPAKTFRSAFLQVKQEPYIESARAYGTSNWRIITRYMVPRILPVLIPQLITLIPGFVFLEATLGLFNIRSNYPTWGKIFYDALNYGLSYGSRFWVVQPLALLLLTGFAFAVVGFALDRILNPRLDHTR